MCLPVSRLFWVSSLAYPNLLGTKGYVVVVVVVVVVPLLQTNGSDIAHHAQLEFMEVMRCVLAAIQSAILAHWYLNITKLT
jgi:hypothetical protein